MDYLTDSVQRNGLVVRGGSAGPPIYGHGFARLAIAELYGMTADEPLMYAMQRVGLDPNLKRRIGQYSQGMRQRLSLARAIFHSPRLLLLDEPFSNVDPDSALQIARLLAAMRDEGNTIILVTHQVGLLSSLADEYVLMSRGQLADRGSLKVHA